MSKFSRIALTILIIGGLNWGLIGFFQYDLVAALFGGQDAWLSRVVYGLVGLSALACLGLLFMPNEEADTATDRHTRFANPSLNTEFSEEPLFGEDSNVKKDELEVNRDQDNI